MEDKRKPNKAREKNEKKLKLFLEKNKQNGTTNNKRRGDG